MNNPGKVSMLNIFFGAVAGIVASMALSSMMLVREYTNGKPFKIGNAYYVCSPIKQDQHQRMEENDDTPIVSKEEKRAHLSDL